MISRLETLQPRTKAAFLIASLILAALFARAVGAFHGSAGGAGLRTLAVGGALTVFVLAIFLLYPLLRPSRTSIQRWLIGLQLASGAMLTFLLPPFQGPDEIAHWQQAVQMYRSDIEQEPFLLHLPEVTHASDLPFHPDHRFDPNVLRGTLDADMMRPVGKIGYASPLSYPFVACVSVFFPKVQSLPEALVFYYLCRLLPILALSVLLFWMAARFELPFIALFFLSLPLVQQQFIVVSSDTLVNFSAILAVPLAVMLWKNFSLRAWIGLSAMCLVATYAKVYVGPLLLLPLLVLPWRRLPAKRVTVPAAFFVAIVALFATAKVVEGKLSNGGNLNDAATAQGQIAYLKTMGGFKYFLITYWNHISSIWYMSTFSSYLGWLDTQLCGHHFFLLRWSFIVAFLLDLYHFGPRLVHALRHRWKEIAAAVSIGAATFVIMSITICAIMFVSETPPGYGGFVGMQARYLFPALLVPLLLPALIFDKRDETSPDAELEVPPPLRSIVRGLQVPAAAFAMGLLPFLLAARAVQLFVDVTARFW